MVLIGNASWLIFIEAANDGTFVFSHHLVLTNLLNHVNMLMLNLLPAQSALHILSTLIDAISHL